jgi:hypothetical protein
MKTMMALAFSFFSLPAKGPKTLITEIRSVKKISSFIRDAFDGPKEALLKAGYKLDSHYKNDESPNEAAKALTVWNFRTIESIENKVGADRGSISLYENLAIVRAVDFSIYYGDGHAGLYQPDLDELQKQIAAMGYKLVRKEKEGKIYKHEAEQRTIILEFEPPFGESDGSILLVLGFSSYME